LLAITLLHGVCAARVGVIGKEHVLSNGLRLLLSLLFCRMFVQLLDGAGKLAKEACTKTLRNCSTAAIALSYGLQDVCSAARQCWQDAGRANMLNAC
jgi:hypothetical protein